MVNIALAQLNFTVGAIAENAEKILACYHDAKQNNVDILVFPELALSGYPPEDLLLRNDFLEQVDEAAKRLIAAFTEIDVVLTYPRKKQGQRYNSAIWVRDGKMIGEYDKHDLPNEGLFDEERYFEQGRGTLIVESHGLRFGVLICEDMWHKNTILQYANQNVNAMISTNGSPFRVDKHQVRVNAIENVAEITQAPVLYVNHVGSQDEFLFDGQSLAANAQGEIVAMASTFSEALLTVSLDKNGIEKQKLPTHDRLSLIYEGLVTGTRDYIEKNHFPGAIIGLSGGIDSALTLAIAADALGADRIHAVLMPSDYTADMSIEDAIKQAQTLGISYDIIPISTIFEGFLKELTPAFRGAKRDTTEENLQARIRGTLLMALSNKTGKLVLTTGNKSEMAVGYATLYGDMVGGFAVLKDVYKTLVYELAHFVNRKETIIPERVITRPPSAELAYNQKDQDSLPPYEILDAIIKAFVEEDASVNDIVAKGYDIETALKVIQLIQRNEYKRRQAPPGIRITSRAFGRNRRYPITSGFKPEQS